MYSTVYAGKNEKMQLTITKYAYIKSITVYVPQSELGLSQPLSLTPPPETKRWEVRGWGSPNYDYWRKAQHSACSAADNYVGLCELFILCCLLCTDNYVGLCDFFILYQQCSVSYRDSKVFLFDKQGSWSLDVYGPTIVHVERRAGQTFT